MGQPEIDEAVDPKDLEIVTFYINETIAGVALDTVREITRPVGLTPVPGSPAHVRGVLNLRGDVVTVLDLRVLVGLEPLETSSESRHLIVSADEERIALLVDRIAEVQRIRSRDIEPLPDNFSQIERRYFSGVSKLETKLVALLNVAEVVSVQSTSSLESEGIS